MVPPRERQGPSWAPHQAMVRPQASGSGSPSAGAGFWSLDAICFDSKAGCCDSASCSASLSAGGLHLVSGSHVPVAVGRAVMPELWC